MGEDKKVTDNWAAAAERTEAFAAEFPIELRDLRQTISEKNKSESLATIHLMIERLTYIAEAIGDEIP